MSHGEPAESATPALIRHHRAHQVAQGGRRARGRRPHHRVDLKLRQLVVDERRAVRAERRGHDAIADRGVQRVPQRRRVPCEQGVDVGPGVVPRKPVEQRGWQPGLIADLLAGREPDQRLSRDVRDPGKVVELRYREVGQRAGPERGIEPQPQQFEL